MLLGEYDIVTTTIRGSTIYLIAAIKKQHGDFPIRALYLELQRNMGQNEISLGIQPYRVETKMGYARMVKWAIYRPSKIREISHIGHIKRLPTLKFNIFFASRTCDGTCIGVFGRSGITLVFGNFENDIVR